MARGRKELTDAATTMGSWWGSESKEYRKLVLRILSSLPGGEEAEDYGFEPHDWLGWQEVSMLGDLLQAVQSDRDVARVTKYLLHIQTGLD